MRLKKKTGIYWVLSCLRVTPFRDKSPIRGHAHRHSRQYHRIKGRATVAEAAPGPRRGRRAWCYSIHAVACHFFFLLAAMRPASADLVDCCTGPAAIVDCSSGVEYEGQVYYGYEYNMPYKKGVHGGHASTICCRCCGYLKSQVGSHEVRGLCMFFEDSLCFQLSWFVSQGIAVLW